MMRSNNGSDSASDDIVDRERNDVAERDRLISKGRGVLDLCIEQNKLLCVQGFVDSQMERGGVHLEVVKAMRDYIAQELTKDNDKNRKKSLRTLQEYVGVKLGALQEQRDVVSVD